MPTGTIDRLIINSPYDEPVRHWRYERETRMFSLEEGRRPAGYIRATEGSRSFDDPGEFIELPLVNRIRPRVKAWREAQYPGVTGITKKLLEHWRDAEQREGRRFFFCQLEAIETLIWLTEAPSADRVGIELPGDGGEFARICCKMATGSGKTVVMAMIIAWQVLNKATYPQDKRFSKHVFVVAPGLTVKNRLQVLIPGTQGNYYDEFRIIPDGLEDRLRRGVLVRNWHTLNWETEEQIKKRRSVDKRGVKSDEAYVREVLGELAPAQNIVVINDEAHHAWRVPPKSTIKGVRKEDIDEATKWVGGLDRIHRARGILACYDLTATPFAPTGKRSGEETLFDWIVSDFGLNDAIESGLVKTPRVVVRDDARLTADYKSRLYHIYNDPEVKDDLTRKAEPHEPLPDLIVNGYYLLGKDWLETANLWRSVGLKTPPVMITVANRTETAARVKYALDHRKVRIDELCDPARTLHIDSKVLEEAEAQDEAPASDHGSDEPQEVDEEQEEAPSRKLTKKQQAERLRRTVDTIGQTGQPGEQIQKVISVGMLSEGWDAKTVTHIMGLRAFTSQLLCEQVVGRGLRRTSYEVDPETGLFEPEYVNIFGVPFTFLPHEGGDGPPPPPPQPKTRIEPDPAKKQHELSWPNVTRIDHTYKPRLSLDILKTKILELDAYQTTTLAELAPVVAGKPDVTKLSQIDLEQLGHRFRWQKIAFEAARDVYDQMAASWKGDPNYLIGRLVRIIEEFAQSDRIEIQPALFSQDDLRRRIIITLNMNKLVQHIWEAIKYENVEALEPIFDQHPIRSTGEMRTWYTGRPCEYTKKSHISHCVFDSTWEATEAFVLDRSESVVAWVKNDHLGFEIIYIYKGVVKKYRPDFLIRSASGKMLVLEVKGQDTQEDKTKQEFLDEWTRAVNNHGGFGDWFWDVSRHPGDIQGLLQKHTNR